jgi:hypothetical protein
MQFIPVSLARPLQRQCHRPLPLAISHAASPVDKLRSPEREIRGTSLYSQYLRHKMTFDWSPPGSGRTPRRNQQNAERNRSKLKIVSGKK